MRRLLCLAFCLPLLCSSALPAADGVETAVLSVETPDYCTVGSHALCLARDRFTVEVEWTDFAGASGPATVLPFQSDDSGILWFFHPGNWEMMVKVLDGCAFNQRFWVFAAATTNVEYTLRVTDHAAGVAREYHNPLGNAAPAITDTDAFPTCDVAGGRPSLLLFANPDILPIGGTSLLTVIARDGIGDPAGPGERIELEADLGSVPAEIFTDAAGQAEAIFDAGGQPGQATVTATLEGGEPASVELTILEAPDAQLLIFANPSFLLVLQSSEITVIARDALGIPLGGGRRIRLLADLGTVDPEEVFTDDHGEAAATFTAGIQPGTGTVTAVMSGSDTAGVAVTIRDAAAEVVLVANPAVVPRIFDGFTVQLTAFVASPLGQPFPQETVHFESERGVLERTAVISNAAGEAQTALIVRAEHVQDVPENGIFTVTATVFSGGSVLQDSVTLTVLGAP